MSTQSINRLNRVKVARARAEFSHRDRKGRKDGFGLGNLGSVVVRSATATGHKFNLRLDGRLVVLNPADAEVVQCRQSLAQVRVAERVSFLERNRLVQPRCVPATA